MDIKDVHQILSDLFKEELTNERHRHIVFWYDEAQEFVDDIDNINIEGVRVWKFSNHNLFATKYELEKQDTTSHFLLYTNETKPAPQEDWLYNLYKIGSEFTADKLTIYMRKLGLEDDRLRKVFMEYSQFFNSQARFESFSKYPVDKYTEEIVDLNVLGALTRSRLNTLDEILKALFHHEYHGKYEAWNAIRKLGNEEKFWLLIEKQYGYAQEDRTLQSLLRFFMLTYLTEQSVDITYPKIWTEYISSRPSNVIVFMNQWMNHRQDRTIYNDMSKDIAELCKVELYIREWDIEELKLFDAFEIFDKRIILYIVEQLTEDVGHFDHYESLIMLRRKTHWYPEFSELYEVLLQAVRFFKSVSDLKRIIMEEPAEELFQSYINKYYHLDTFYRKFYVSYDRLSSKEIVRSVREKLEKMYTNWFLQELSVQWSESLSRRENSGWYLPTIQKQSEFFVEWVKPYVQKEQRVFVIISDALRYEVAKELTADLNSERKATSELIAIQSVLPTSTAFGMASLLPYKNINLSADGEVIIDGIRTSSTENRQRILQQYVKESNAFTYDDINTMDRDSLRKACAGKRVIYIYHNTIDAFGDQVITEADVFEGVEEAMKDIRDLINRLVNNLSAANILVTGDHGFIYQRDRLEMSQLTPKQVKGNILENRRFILSEEQIEQEGTFSYPLDEMIQDEEMKYVTVPKGINRFQVQGAGANYVHGGAMLQEIVIPVIVFKNDRSKSQENVVRQVDVKLTSSLRKITSIETILEFFQVSSVGEKVLPRQLRVYFVDEDDHVISNECVMIADLTANEAIERTWKERFIFKLMTYDRAKNYYLVLEDENGKEYERHQFTVDIIPNVE